MTFPENEYIKAKELIDKSYGKLPDGNDRELDISGEAPFVKLRGFSELSGITHGFTTRLGGVSEGCFSSLNLGFTKGDDRASVLRNYQIIGKSMGIDCTRMVMNNQVHSSDVHVAREEEAGDGVIRAQVCRTVDALVTNVKNLPLAVFSADCVPILFTDPVSRVIGAAHAGWKGTVTGIAAKTVHKMVEEFGCLPENIYAAIGPSIGYENYEVSQDVIDEVVRCPYIDMSETNLALQELPGAGAKKDLLVGCRAGSYIRENMPEDYIGITQANPGAVYNIFRTVNIRQRFMLNLWNLNELILVNAGLSMSHIFNTRLCTMQYHDYFFSYRYSGGKCGVHAGIICLNK